MTNPIMTMPKWFVQLQARFRSERRKYKLRQLKRRVLKHGGITFQREGFLLGELDDWALNASLKYGNSISAENATVTANGNNACQVNSVIYCRRNPGYRKWVGFALNAEGTWWYHSWVANEQTGAIVETTQARSKYFGVEDPPEHYTPQYESLARRTIALQHDPERPHSSLGYQTPNEFAGRSNGSSGLRSGFALPPSRTAEQNIKPMAGLYE
jgi:hypothetical protein